jgi:hypothetical protein
VKQKKVVVRLRNKMYEIFFIIQSNKYIICCIFAKVTQLLFAVQNIHSQNESNRNKKIGSNIRKQNWLFEFDIRTPKHNYRFSLRIFSCFISLLIWSWLRAQLAKNCSRIFCIFIHNLMKKIIIWIFSSKFRSKYTFSLKKPQCIIDLCRAFFTSKIW